jgi:hypothetical protein
MRSSIVSAVSLLLLGLFVPPPAAAQDDVHVRLSLLAGFVTPSGPLGRQYSAGAKEGSVLLSVTDLGVFPIFGLSVDVGGPESGGWLKARVSRSLALGADFTVSESMPCGPGGICYFEPPPRTTWDWQPYADWRLEASVTEVGLDLVPLPGRVWGGIEPFVVVGGGVRRFQFTRPRRSEGQNLALPDEGTAVSVRLGGGLELPLMGRLFSLTILDTVSEYWERYRHHVSWEIGIPVVSEAPFSS